MFLTWLFQDWDGKESNYFKADNKIGRIDFEWSLFPIRINRPGIAQLTLKDLENFPNLKNFPACTWLHGYEELQYDKDFRNEYYTTIHKVLITSNQSYKTIFERVTQGLPAKYDHYRFKVYTEFEHIVERLKKLTPEFADYQKFAAEIYSDQIEKELAESFARIIENERVLEHSANQSRICACRVI